MNLVVAIVLLYGGFMMMTSSFPLGDIVTVPFFRRELEYSPTTQSRADVSDEEATLVSAPVSPSTGMSGKR